MDRRAQRWTLEICRGNRHEHERFLWNVKSQVDPTGNKVMAKFATLFLTLSLALFACSKPAPSTAQSSNVHVAPTQFSHNATDGAAPPTLAPMLAKVSPAVVSISVQGTVQTSDNPLFQDPLFKRFFGFQDSPMQDNAPLQRFQSVGSGVIYDANKGYVITNKHVVNRADKILVTLSDRRQLEAKLVAADAQTDIAVLKVTSDKLSALPIGNSKDLAVGDYVVAVGNPFGVGQTATFGIVSALGRSGLGIEGYEDFIQTDAAVNPGNSGGALVDMTGRLVGINTAILSKSGGNVGIGFAIPMDMVKSVAEQLIEHGHVSRGELGVAIQDLTPSLARAMGIEVSNGALVSQVRPGSSADRSGIREGDIIIGLNGEAIANSAQLRNKLGQEQPGTVVRMTLSRGGKEHSVTATLGALTTTAERHFWA
jgi:serine protease DegQ